MTYVASLHDNSKVIPDSALSLDPSQKALKFEHSLPQPGSGPLHPPALWVPLPSCSCFLLLIPSPNTAFYSLVHLSVHTTVYREKLETTEVSVMVS